MSVSTKYADVVQVILETRTWKCGTCSNAAKFNSIKGHDNEYHLANHLEVIAWFKANNECCAKAGA